MSPELETAWLRRQGFASDGEVLRHPEWRGWVHWDSLRRQWVASDPNRVDRAGSSVADLLRRSGFKPAGVPS